MGLNSYPQSAARAAIPQNYQWPKQGQWTYEDYCRLPDDGWIYEVIEGELYMSPAPLTRHQRCKIRLAHALYVFAQKHDAGEVLDAPLDVMLPDLATPVQPDIVFVAKSRADIVKEERIEGVPDLMVEVLSPWNWIVDRRKKFVVYAKAGVREYCIVDPQGRTIELFVLKKGAFELVGKYGVGKTVRSKVLKGFVAAVKEVCPA